jgi:hypothetical protein
VAGRTFAIQPSADLDCHSKPHMSCRSTVLLLFLTELWHLSLGSQGLPSPSSWDVPCSGQTNPLNRGQVVVLLLGVLISLEINPMASLCMALYDLH